MSVKCWMLYAGQTIGHYNLVRKIGQGNWAVVWLAEQTQSQTVPEQVALKFPLAVDFRIIEQEAVVWSQASGHPNILRFIEAAVYDDQVVIVSEYAPDGSLADWLKKCGGKAPSIRSAYHMMDGVLAGLEHLHAPSRKIVHRDLKPSNILLKEDIPLVADFGVARRLGDSLQSSNIAGTELYMAPEAFDGWRNEQTDLWSAGVIFYQMISGKRPFDKVSHIHTQEAILLPETVPGELRNILKCALNKNPQSRYQSAKQFRNDLLKAAEGQSQRAKFEIPTRGLKTDKYINDKNNSSNEQQLPVDSGGFKARKEAWSRKPLEKLWTEKGLIPVFRTIPPMPRSRFSYFIEPLSITPFLLTSACYGLGAFALVSVLGEPTLDRFGALISVRNLALAFALVLLIPILIWSGADYWGRKAGNRVDGLILIKYFYCLCAQAFVIFIATIGINRLAFATPPATGGILLLSLSVTMIVLYLHRYLDGYYR